MCIDTHSLYSLMIENQEALVLMTLINMESLEILGGTRLKGGDELAEKNEADMQRKTEREEQP